MSVNSPVGTGAVAPVKWNNTAAAGEYRDLDVRATFNPLTSTISTTPPPAEQVEHQIEVTAIDTEALSVKGKAKSGVKHPLYRMPSVMANRRYGQPSDKGFDDWCSRKTYLWIQQNHGLLSRVNDISGEHSRDLVHTTHLQGTDIDIYHFRTIPGANPARATSNLHALQDQTRRAIAGHAAAIAEVRTWVESERLGISALILNADVRKVTTAFGKAFSAKQVVKPDGTTTTVALPSGWQRDLLRTGKIGEFDCGAGEWADRSSPKVSFDSWAFVHDNHHHVSLTP